MGSASRLARRLGPGLLAAGALLLLAACGRLGGPAPVVAYGPGGASTRPAPRPASQPIESAAGEIVVRPGDTLYAVSRRTHAPLRALIDANNLHPPYALQSGQRLLVPRVRGYHVQPGDTLSAVARRYGIGLNELVQANALTPPYGLRVGQVLVLPPGPHAAPAAPAAVAAAPPPYGASVRGSALPPPVASPVASSPLPSSPSGHYDPAAVAPRGVPLNGPPPPLAPPAVAAATPGAAAAAPAAPMPPPAAPTSLAAEPARLAPGEPPVEAAPTHPGRFLWPVRGTVVSDYGSKPGGLQNDGINIAAPRGTPIRAADAGVVVYAGNELRGFGNLLLVKHPGGWVTAYAHAQEILVHRGEEVRRGQIVARVGATGGVSSPQLHFEVRKGAHALNPRDYLGPQTASASP